MPRRTQFYGVVVCRFRKVNISARVTRPCGQYDHWVQPVVVPDASSQSMAGPANESADTSLKLAGVDPSGEPSSLHRNAAISALVTVDAGQNVVAVHPEVTSLA